MVIYHSVSLHCGKNYNAGVLQETYFFALSLKKNMWVCYRKQTFAVIVVNARVPRHSGYLLKIELQYKSTEDRTAIQFYLQ